MAYERYHTTEVPVNTFNKVWIVPDEAVVYEKDNSAYVLKSHLKVMLEEDYLSQQKHNVETRFIASSKKDAINGVSTNQIGSQIIREIVLPELQKEVNEGKNFASLRQIYSAMILATWYKKALKESLLGKVYADKAKVKGVDQDPKSNEAIYQQYLKAFKKGVYNYIKDDFDKYSKQSIPRKYFSGGFTKTLNPDKEMQVFNPKNLPPNFERDRTALSLQAQENRFDNASISLRENKSVPDLAMDSTLPDEKSATTTLELIKRIRYLLKNLGDLHDNPALAEKYGRRDALILFNLFHAAPITIENDFILKIAADMDDQFIARKSGEEIIAIISPDMTVQRLRDTKPVTPVDTFKSHPADFKRIILLVKPHGWDGEFKKVLNRHFSGFYNKTRLWIKAFQKRKGSSLLDVDRQNLQRLETLLNDFKEAILGREYEKIIDILFSIEKDIPFDSFDDTYPPRSQAYTLIDSLGGVAMDDFDWDKLRRDFGNIQLGVVNEDVGMVSSLPNVDIPAVRNEVRSFSNVTNISNGFGGLRTNRRDFIRFTVAVALGGFLTGNVKADEKEKVAKEKKAKELLQSYLKDVLDDQIQLNLNNVYEDWVEVLSKNKDKYQDVIKDKELMTFFIRVLFKSLQNAMKKSGNETGNSNFNLELALLELTTDSNEKREIFLKHSLPRYVSVASKARSALKYEEMQSKLEGELLLIASQADPELERLLKGVIEKGNFFLQMAGRNIRDLRKAVFIEAVNKLNSYLWDKKLYINTVILSNSLLGGYLYMKSYRIIDKTVTNMDGNKVEVGHLKALDTIIPLALSAKTEKKADVSPVLFLDLIQKTAQKVHKAIQSKAINSFEPIRKALSSKMPEVQLEKQIKVLQTTQLQLYQKDFDGRTENQINEAVIKVVTEHEARHYSDIKADLVLTDVQEEVRAFAQELITGKVHYYTLADWSDSVFLGTDTDEAARTVFQALVNKSRKLLPKDQLPKEFDGLEGEFLSEIDLDILNRTLKGLSQLKRETLETLAKDILQDKAMIFTLPQWPTELDPYSDNTSIEMISSPQGRIRTFTFMDGSKLTGREYKLEEYSATIWTYVTQGAKRESTVFSSPFLVAIDETDAPWKIVFNEITNDFKRSKAHEGKDIGDLAMDAKITFVELQGLLKDKDHSYQNYMLRLIQALLDNDPKVLAKTAEVEPSEVEKILKKLRRGAVALKAAPKLIMEAHNAAHIDTGVYSAVLFSFVNESREPLVNDNRGSIEYVLPWGKTIIIPAVSTGSAELRAISIERMLVGTADLLSNFRMPPDVLEALYAIHSSQDVRSFGVRINLILDGRLKDPKFAEHFEHIAQLETYLRTLYNLYLQKEKKSSPADQTMTSTSGPKDGAALSEAEKHLYRDAIDRMIELMATPASKYGSQAWMLDHRVVLWETDQESWKDKKDSPEYQAVKFLTRRILDRLKGLSAGFIVPSDLMVYTILGKGVNSQDLKQHVENVLKEIKQDYMLSVKPEKTGGIDLNSANLNLQIKRDGKGVPLPIDQQDLANINIEGFVPVIIDIKPISELPLLS